jgi:hypothetical protein
MQAFAEWPCGKRLLQHLAASYIKLIGLVSALKIYYAHLKWELQAIRMDNNGTIKRAFDTRADAEMSNWKT